jgi:hypothetical protein
VAVVENYTKLDKDPLEDITRCIVISGMKYHKDENLEAKVSSLLEAMGPVIQDLKIVACKRLGKLDKTYPLVKVAFLSQEDKISVLKKKQALRNTGEYSRVYLRTSKSFAERVMDANMKTLIELVQPKEGSQYRVNSQGRLFKKDSTEDRRK